MLGVIPITNATCIDNITLNELCTNMSTIMIYNDKCSDSFMPCIDIVQQVVPNIDNIYIMPDYRYGLLEALVVVGPIVSTRLLRSVSCGAKWHDKSITMLLQTNIRSKDIIDSLSDMVRVMLSSTDFSKVNFMLQSDDSSAMLLAKRYKSSRISCYLDCRKKSISEVLKEYYVSGITYEDIKEYVKLIIVDENYKGNLANDLKEYWLLSTQVAVDICDYTDSQLEFYNKVYKEINMFNPNVEVV